MRFKLEMRPLAIKMGAFGCEEFGYGVSSRPPAIFRIPHRAGVPKGVKTSGGWYYFLLDQASVALGRLDGMRLAAAARSAVVPLHVCAQGGGTFVANRGNAILLVRPTGHASIVQAIQESAQRIEKRCGAQVSRPLCATGMDGCIALP